MNGEPLRHIVTVNNPQGLHMRPITSFVEAANRFKSSVQVTKEGGSPINGKSPLGLLGLAAEQGTRLTLEVDGADAQEAMTALIEVLDRQFDD